MYVYVYVSVPQDVCLLGCIFYIADYPKYIDPSALEMWREVLKCSHACLSIMSLKEQTS